LPWRSTNQSKKQLPGNYPVFGAVGGKFGLLTTRIEFPVGRCCPGDGNNKVGPGDEVTGTNCTGVPGDGLVIIITGDGFSTGVAVLPAFDLFAFVFGGFGDFGFVTFFVVFFFFVFGFSLNSSSESSSESSKKIRGNVVGGVTYIWGEHVARNCDGGSDWGERGERRKGGTSERIGGVCESGRDFWI
jgi:hypothetical protein